jgi:hypothetical protein
MNIIPNYCYITSWIILIQGLIAYTYIPLDITLSHVVLGLTSVIHHSRRYKWYIIDIYTILDYLALILYLYLLTNKYLWKIILNFLMLGIVMNFINFSLNFYKKYKLMAIIHCSYHLLFIILVPKYYYISFNSF